MNILKESEDSEIEKAKTNKQKNQTKPNQNKTKNKDNDISFWDGRLVQQLNCCLECLHPLRMTALI